MELASTLGTKHLEVGIFLGLMSNKVHHIVPEYEHEAPINVNILETWCDNRRHRESISGMYEKLCEALLNIGHDTVRNAEDESSGDSKLRVTCFLRKYSEPALWRTVYNHIITNGDFDLSKVIPTVQQLQEMNLKKCRLAGKQLGNLLSTVGHLQGLTELRYTLSQGTCTFGWTTKTCTAD